MGDPLEILHDALEDDTIYFEKKTVPYTADVFEKSKTVCRAF